MIDVDSLKSRTDIAQVVGHFVPLLKRGREWVGKCVAHSPDNHPSMWIAPQKGLIHCFACGWSGDVIDFLMHVEGVDFRTACERLGATDRWEPSLSVPQSAPQPARITSKPPLGTDSPDMTLRGLGRPSRVWPYRDASGDLLGYAARYENEGGKEFRCWTWGARGDEPAAWGVGHWNRPRPLYGLDRLTTRATDPVLIVEGERAADAAGRLLPNYVAVTWPGGAQAVHHADWEAMRGRRCLLWPDEDLQRFENHEQAERFGLNKGDLLPKDEQPGRRAMLALAAVLSDPAGLGCSVKVIDTGGMPAGFDCADAETDGWTTAQVIEWAKPRASVWTVKQADTAQDEPQANMSGPQDEPPSDINSDPPLPPVSVAQPRPQLSRRPSLSVVGGTEAATAREVDPEAIPLPQALSDDALADYFAARHGETYKHVPEWSSSDKPRWYEWQDDGWQIDVLESHFSKALEVTRKAAYWPEAAALSPRQKRSLNSAAQCNSLLSVARRDSRMATRREAWDSDQWLLGVPGGAVDLREGKLLAADPNDYITRHCAVAPVAGPHPLFDKVLARATGGDPEMTAYLWRWFGYMLTGDTREECFLFLHGQGGSGKSTLTKAIGDILGDYAASCKMETFAETHQPKHAEELARLDGARLALTSETDEGQRWNESRIKWLTGRNKITANFMRSNSFEYTPRFKLLIEGNHRPGLKSVGEEMRRRIHLVEYAGTIPEADRDRTLKDKMVAEYPAILASMIRGCLDWQARGLQAPQVVKEAVEQYLESEDTLGAWIDECCELKAGAPIQASAAYKSFRTWSETHGEYCPSQKRFSTKLQDRGFVKRRTHTGSQFVGLELKLPDAPADWR